MKSRMHNLGIYLVTHQSTQGVPVMMHFNVNPDGDPAVWECMAEIKAALEVPQIMAMDHSWRIQSAVNQQLRLVAQAWSGS